jgi:predicted MPP superfamily phosphohydrolase
MADMKRIFKILIIVFIIFICCRDIVLANENSHGIAFISDTQEPTILDRLILPYDKNEEASDSLFSDIYRQAPSALFILGDIVSFGFEDKLWDKTDQRLSKLKSESIPVYAIPGNHEYVMKPSDGIKTFQKRFPGQSHIGFFVVHDSIAIIMLNSNFINLSQDEIDHELKWYNKTIDSLNNTGLKAIIVCCHHPPYSNIMIVRSSKVRDLLLPAFNRNPKAKLFLSGHLHKLEHFNIESKDYVILGGGGGVKQNMLKDKPYSQGFMPTKQKLLFFYLIVKRTGNEIVVTARGINKDFAKFTEFEVAIIKLD